MPEFFWQNHGCGDDWTCQRAAACFVDAGYASDAISAEFFLITKSAAPIRHRQKLSADCADFHTFFWGKQASRPETEICETKNRLTRAPLLLPCLCGYEDNSVLRGERVPLAPPRFLRCAANAAGKLAPRLRHTRFGAR